MDAQKAAVTDFLRRCVAYADESIIRKQNREEDATEIERWRIYREFTAYALMEVSRGQLDDWFSDAAEQTRKASTFHGESLDPEAMASTAIDHLDFAPRAAWMSAMIAPRPLVLLSTTGPDGTRNLCPATSVAVLSNHPAMLGISLSQDRDGRPRDTLANLRDAGVGARVTAMVLPTHWPGALLVDATATPMPREESEWNRLDADPVDSPSPGEWPALHPLAAGALECELVELHPLPEPAVSTLAILRVVNVIHTTRGISRDGGPPDADTWRPLLCQFGQDRLTSGPDGADWSFTVRSHRDADGRAVPPSDWSRNRDD